MNGVSVLSAVVIGVLAGWIAEKVTGRDHGLLANLCVGLVGAFIGAWGARLVGLDFHGFVGDLLVSTAGAILLLVVLGLRGRRQ